MVLRTSAGMLGATAILGVGGLAFWAIVGHNAGSRTLGQTATAVSLATLAAMLSAAGAIHFVIARRPDLRALVSALAIASPLVAAAIAGAVAPRWWGLVALLAAGLALGMVVDAAALAAHRPRRVTARAGMQVGGILVAAVWIHTLEGFLVAQVVAAVVAASVQLAHWRALPDFRLLARLGREVWSYHLAGVTGQAPAFVVAPMAALLSTPEVAGQAYIAMAIVGPLTSLSVSLSVGVHAEGSTGAAGTRQLFLRVMLAVTALAAVAAACTPVLHLLGPAFAAAAPAVAVMVFATVFDAASNIWASLWRLQKRLVVVPLLYVAELVAFVAAVAATMPALGLQSVVWGWYAQGIVGVLVVVAVEHRLIPPRPAVAPPAAKGPVAVPDLLSLSSLTAPVEPPATTGGGPPEAVAQCAH